MTGDRRTRRARGRGHGLSRVRRALAGLVLALLVAPAPARASADVRIDYAALQRLLAEQVFTTEGRRYVKGTKDSRCSYGYLEHPVVDGADGRLRIRARFSGRSAVDLFGHCVGFGDDFDLVISAVPYYRDAALRLNDVRVETATKGFYPRRVCSALADSLQAQFVYPVLQEVRKALEEPSASPGYRRVLRRFDVRQLTVTPDALTLSIDLEILVTGAPPTLGPQPR